MFATSTGKPPDPSPSQVETGSAPEFSPIRLLHGAHAPSQADIWLVEWNGTRCVLRDYSAPRAWYWRFLCRWAVWRELHVHHLLEGIVGIPRILVVIDQDRYLMEYIEGVPLNNRVHSPDATFFENLEYIACGMHDRRVAHGDLRNKNILVGPGQNPYVIDFSTAWWGTSLWRVPLFKFYKRLDQRRLTLAKAKFFPNHFTDQELAQIEKGPLYIRLGRFYRRYIYPFLTSRRRAQQAGKKK